MQLIWTITAECDVPPEADYIGDRRVAEIDASLEDLVADFLMLARADASVSVEFKVTL